jgi:hypothetical protein
MVPSDASANKSIVFLFLILMLIFQFTETRNAASEYQRPRWDQLLSLQSVPGKRCCGYVRSFFLARYGGDKNRCSGILFHVLIMSVAVLTRNIFSGLGIIV